MDECVMDDYEVWMGMLSLKRMHSQQSFGLCNIRLTSDMQQVAHDATRRRICLLLPEFYITLETFGGVLLQTLERKFLD